MPDMSKIHNLAGELKSRVRQTAKPDARRWYNIKNVTGGTAEVYLYDMIGEWGTTAQDFVTEIKAINATTIELHISSEGGEVFDGVAIYECLKAHPAYIDVIVDSLAASIASVIAMAGDRVRMTRNARMMIHDAAIGGAFGSGNEKNMREFATAVLEMADLLADMSLNLADIYAQRAGGTPGEWRTRMLAETWYSAQAAKAIGLIDGIMGEEDSSTTPVEPAIEDVALDVAALQAALKEAFNA